MSLLTEFKKFAVRGNVVDLAVGVIIGASFTGIVNSLVNDVLMPPIGLGLGGVDFANFFVEEDFVGKFAVEDLLTDLRDALGAQGICGTGPA